MPKSSRDSLVGNTDLERFWVDYFYFAFNSELADDRNLLGDLLGLDSLAESVVEASVDVLQVTGSSSARSDSSFCLLRPVELI